MHEWEMAQISDLILADEADLQTGPFGTQLKASEYVEAGVPVINVRNIGYGTVVDAKLEYITEKTADRLKVHRLVEGDIVFGRKGAVERHALIDKKTQGWIQGSDCLRLRIKSERVSTKFLSHYFNTAAHKLWMEAQCSFGATMSSLNQDIVKRISYPNLPPATQNKIAAILSAYDELIENNRRRIALLERMAEEIYREWFVRMRFPGHEQVKVHKGVPEGWKIKSLRALCKINKQSITKGQEPSEINYIDISSVTTGSIDEISTIRFVDAPSRARRVVKHGDIIWSTVRPANRAYSLILYPVDNLIVSTGFAVISPNPEIPYSYLYFTTTNDAFVEHIAIVAKGAAYPAASVEDFERVNVLVPCSHLLLKFHEQCQPVFEQVHLLKNENVNLQKTRDLLLSRLIAGKLAVDDLDIHFPPGMAAEP